MDICQASGCSDPTDEILVRQVLNGDDPAFQTLMARHQSGVYRLAYHWTGNRDDALDLTQECFVHLYGVLDRYDQRYRFHVWMYRVCHNRCINWIKANRRARETVPFSHLADNPLDVPDASPGPEEWAAKHETSRELQTAIEELPDKYRTAIALRYMEDLTYKEIAAVMNITVKNVEIRIHRAKKMLHASLTKHVMEPTGTSKPRTGERSP